ncbi:MAG: VanW family protein [Herpetosiphon sp.]
MIILLLIIVGTVTISGLHYLDQRYAGRIYPNISIQGIDVGEKTPDEALALVQQRFGPFLDAPVRFEYAGTSWTPTGQAAGITTDVAALVARAGQVGRGQGLVSDVLSLYQLSRQGLDLPLIVTLDQPTLHSYVQGITSGLERPPVEANVQIDPVKSSLIVADSREGRMALLDDTAAEVREHLSTLEPFVVPIHTQTLKPLVNNDGVAEARRTVEAMLRGPLTFRFKDQTNELKTSDIAAMISINRVQGTAGPQLNAQIDQKLLRKWVIKLADKVGRESIEPRVAWNGGNLMITQPGRTAYRVDIDRTLTRINEAVVGTERKLDLPVDEVQPRVTAETLGTLGIKELISVGQSDFTGSAAYRITNIKAGAHLMDGILVPPDGEFSFDENVGAIDEAHGFTEGYAIVGNRTQKEPGGGICQISTTLFRAAFYAGVPFTDWTPHRFRISWYEKYDSIGMDSTIFTGGGPDLRFVNDTGHWMLIEGKVDDAKALVSMSIYGTKVPGRVIQRSEPQITNESPSPKENVYIDDAKEPLGTYHQTDVARGGLDINIERIIMQDGQVKSRRNFITRFQPWPNIFLKNPQTPLPAGGKLGAG